MNDTRKDLTRWLALANGFAVLFVASISFIISFDALRLLAEANGMQPPYSWLFPFTVDATMIALSLSAVVQTVHGRSTVRVWSLIVFFTLLSMVLNGLHADDIQVQGAAINWIAIAIFALAPMVTLITFETFMGQIRLAVQGNLMRMQHYVSELQDQIAKLNEDRKELQRANRRLQQRSDELTSLKRDFNKVQKQLDKMQGVQPIPSKVGEYGRDLLVVIDGGMTQKDFCDKHNADASYTSRLVSKMNGGISNE